VCREREEKKRVLNIFEMSKKVDEKLKQLFLNQTQVFTWCYRILVLFCIW